MSDPDTLLPHYLKTWNLSNPQPLAQTPTSHVYTVTHGSTRVVLKILTPYGFEERVGALALAHFDGQGAVKLLRRDKDAQLLEYAAGDSLVGMVKAGQDEAATTIIADVINALHANGNPPPAGITTLKRWFRALFLKAEADRKRGLDTIFMRAATLAGSVLDQPLEPRVLHGDIHHDNIRQSSRGWLAFDPKGLYGERTYDLANTLCNPPIVTPDENRILRNVAILAGKCGIDRSRVLLFLFMYACLSASWTLEDGVGGWDIDNVMYIAGVAERHMS